LAGPAREDSAEQTHWSRGYDFVVVDPPWVQDRPPPLQSALPRHHRTVLAVRSQEMLAAVPLVRTHGLDVAFCDGTTGRLADTLALLAYDHTLLPPFLEDAAALDTVRWRALSNAPPLTVRILALVARGRSNEEIARDTGLSVASVKNQVRRALTMLGFVNRTEAAVFYHRAVTAGGANDDVPTG
jgi:DNA-binding NarL/FixJ family response regulator